LTTETVHSSENKSLTSWQKSYTKLSLIFSYNPLCHQQWAASTNFKGNHIQAVNIFSEPMKLLFW